MMNLAKTTKIHEYPADIIADGIRWRMNNLLERAYVEDEALTNALQKVAETLANTNDITNGFYIQGGVGNGKTTLAKAIRRAICDVIIARHPSHVVSPDFYVTSALEICDLARKGDPLYYTLCKCNALLIDDLGLEPVVIKAYGSEITPVITLIHQRYEQRLFTIYTSNRNRPSLEKIYGPRTYSRVKQSTQVINFGNAPDLRLCNS